MLEYFVAEDEIDPDEDEFNPGDVLTCSADSRPQVDYYKWIDAADDEIILEGPIAAQLVIPGDWAGMSKTLRCAVSNEMRDGRVEVSGDNFTFDVLSD